MKEQEFDPRDFYDYEKEESGKTDAEIDAIVGEIYRSVVGGTLPVQKTVDEIPEKGARGCCTEFRNTLFQTVQADINGGQGTKQFFHWTVLWSEAHGVSPVSGSGECASGLPGRKGTPGSSSASGCRVKNSPSR